LQGARHGQERGTVRRSAQRRSGGEHHNAGGEHAAPSDEVGDRAGREQQGRERQGVGVDDPLQVRQRGAEILLNRRQGDVHDRDVQQQHEHPGADPEQGPPLPGHDRLLY
jgi:hypothetical protein